MPWQKKLVLSGQLFPNIENHEKSAKDQYFILLPANVINSKGAGTDIYFAG
jgi:hypothetical protein